MTRPQRFQDQSTRTGFDTIRDYWRDPAPFEAERVVEQAKLNAVIDAAVRRNHPHVGDSK